MPCLWEWAGCCCAEVGGWWSHWSCWPGPHVCLITLPEKPKVLVELLCNYLMWAWLSQKLFSASLLFSYKIKFKNDVMIKKNWWEHYRNQLNHFGKTQTGVSVVSVKWWAVNIWLSNVIPWGWFKCLLDLIRFQCDAHTHTLSHTALTTLPVTQSDALSFMKEF